MSKTRINDNLYLVYSVMENLYSKKCIKNKVFICSSFLLHLQTSLQFVENKFMIN